MILFLRVFFAGVVAVMLGVILWASLHTPLFSIPREVFTHPWFIATALDAYFAFIAFFVWVAWKERSALARVLWLLALLALGNVAIGTYLLRELFRLSPGGGLERMFTQRNPGHVLLPGVLVAASVVVYLLA